MVRSQGTNFTDHICVYMKIDLFYNYLKILKIVFILNYSNFKLLLFVSYFLLF